MHIKSAIGIALIIGGQLFSLTGIAGFFDSIPGANTAEGERVITAVSNNDTGVAGDIFIRAPDVAENGAVVPVEISSPRTFNYGERLYLVVDRKYIGAVLVPYSDQVKVFLSTRVKMDRTGLLTAVLVDNNGRMSARAKEVSVTVGADPMRRVTGSIGPIKVRAVTAGSGLDLKMLANSPQSPDTYIKTVSAYIDGGKHADVLLSPGSSKNPYVGLAFEGGGDQVRVVVDSDSGQQISLDATAGGRKLAQPSWNLPAQMASAPIRHTPPTTQRIADKEAPVLGIPGGDRVSISSGDYAVSGQATDASGIAEVTLDGNPITITKDGHFSVNRYFPIGETELNIQATDIYGNKTTQKVTFVRQPETTLATANEPVLALPERVARGNPEAIALIVGVEDYRNAPKAKWADQDAAIFYDYAQRALGIPASNIRLLTGADASRTAMLTALKTWLVPMITPGKSQVYVYFAGHGLASSDGESAYLIPQDGDPRLLEDTALDRQRLLNEIAKMKPRSATLFFDTCYSGGARGGEMTLVANARPVMIKSKASSLPPGFIQFSASSNDQLAHSHPSQQHGLFSYYLMRGLGGEADTNRDNTLTAGELQDYVQEKVKRMALTQGRPQVPELIGERDKVIAVWAKN